MMDSKIRQMRSAAGLTRHQAGRAFGYLERSAANCWGQLENREGHQFAALRKVAAVLHCDVRDLV